ncbi:MAG: cytochrome c3 family protein [Firmicutes bacterium]|nr:cytochrome c3 family protein [Bacillota bacterium]
MCHGAICSNYAGSVHGGAGLDCASCHDSGLHGQAMTAERSVEICGSCHQQLTEHWQSSTHSGTGLGCIDCHSIHSPAKGRELMQLMKPEDTLCLECHELDKGIHAGILDPDSIERKSCVICHNPHGGDVGLLTAKLGGEKWDLNKDCTHYPVAQGRCSDCHSPHLVSFGSRMDEEENWELEDWSGDEEAGFTGSKQGLLKVGGSALCYQCHTKQQKHFEETGHAKVQNIALNGEQIPCLGCHLPHASDYDSLTKLPGDELCVACHSGYTPHHFLSFGSVKQGELKCVDCHEPHGMPGNKRLLVEKNICSMCHQK